MKVSGLGVGRHGVVVQATSGPALNGDTRPQARRGSSRGITTPQTTPLSPKPLLPSCKCAQIALTLRRAAIIVSCIMAKRAQTGPRPVYAPKQMPAESCLLTELGKRILAAAAERTGAGKSNVVEHLLRKHGGSVTAADFAPLDEDDVCREAETPSGKRVSRSRVTPRRVVERVAVAGA